MAIHLTLGSKRRVPYREDAKILFQKQAVHVFVNGLPGHEKSARVCHGFALLLTVSQMLFRQPVWGRSDYPLDLNPAEVSLFRLWLQCAWVSLFVVALLGFSLLVVASSYCFFRPSERNVREFYGGWFWQVWAWILLGFFCFACMPHKALWLPLEAWILPGFAMVLLCF